MIKALCAAVLATACSLSAPALAAAPTPPPATDGGCAAATAPPPRPSPPTSVNTLRQVPAEQGPGLDPAARPPLFITRVHLTYRRSGS